MPNIIKAADIARGRRLHFSKTLSNTPDRVDNAAVPRVELQMLLSYHLVKREELPKWPT
jgi:hypothetical protein